MSSESIKPAPVIGIPNVPRTRVRHRKERSLWNVKARRDVKVPATALTIRSGHQVRDDRQGDWS